MKKLSKATESKLLSAVDDSAEHVSNGMSPSAAIAKAASDHGINFNSIDPLVHAYNAGMTNRQRHEGTSVLEKIADFEIADADVVRELLRPKTVKSAAQVTEDTAVSAIYRFSPSGVMDRRTRREKAAAAAPVKPPPLVPHPPPPLLGDPNTRAKQAVAKVERLKYAVEESRRRASDLLSKAVTSFEKLAVYFRQTDAMPLPVVRANVALIHGAPGVALLDSLTASSPALTKLATHVRGVRGLGQSGRASFDAATAAPVDGEPYRTIDLLLGQLGDYTRAKTAYDKLALENAERSEVVLRPFAVPSVSPSVLDPSWTEQTEKRGFNPMQWLGYGALMKGMVGGLGSAMKPPEEDAMVQKAVHKLTDPEHEAKLRGINTQAMLQDFLLNDPVISAHDPEDVVNAFNEVTQIAPHASDQRMMMQSLLRKQLQQGQTDPFEVDQLLGMEDKLRKREMPMKGVAGGDPSVM